MTSKTVSHTVDFARNLVTDQQENLNSKKPHRHRAKKFIKDFGGNFSNRSRSVDGGYTHVTGRNEGFFKVLTKDEQIKKLVQRCTDLHNYNDQFAQENERLQGEVSRLTENIQKLSKTLDVSENKKCDICIEFNEKFISLTTEKNSVEEKNQNLQNDVTMMKTLVYRLNVQLERYQEIVRKTGSNVQDLDLGLCSESSVKNTKISDWGPVNTHTLAPLLNAYDEMIKEKCDLVVLYELEINRFTGNLKEIIEENERLQMEMDNLRQEMDGWREEKTRLQAQLDICRTKAEIQSKRADLAKEKLVEVLRCYEQKVQSQSLDLERLQEAYGRAKGELISLRNVQAHPEPVIESLKECQKLFEELKSEHTNEKNRLINELQDAKKIQTDLEENFSKFREENASLKLQLGQYKENSEDLKKKNLLFRQNVYRLKQSKDNLKSRLKIALAWGQKLEENQQKVKNTWTDLKELEALIRNKEAQIRGLHVRHVEEIEKLNRKLQQREETIKNILKEKAKAN